LLILELYDFNKDSASDKLTVAGLGKGRYTILIEGNLIQQPGRKTAFRDMRIGFHYYVFNAKARE